MLAIVYAGAIFYGSSIPAPDLPPVVGMISDKILHVMEYAGFAFLLHQTFSRQPRWYAISQNAILLAVFIAIVYGATDEFHQSFVPGRSTELNDWIADTLGAAVGVVFSIVATAVMRRRSGRQQAQ